MKGGATITGSGMGALDVVIDPLDTDLPREIAVMDVYGRPLTPAGVKNPIERSMLEMLIAKNKIDLARATWQIAEMN